MFRKSSVFIPALLAIVVLVSFILSGCGAGATAQSAPGSSATPAATPQPTTYTPTTFKMAVGLAIDQTTAETKYSEVKSYMAQQLGMPTELYVPTDYTAMIQAMSYKHIDLGFQGPFSYVISKTQFPCIPIAGAAVDGKLSTYNSYLIVRKDSSIKTMADLVANAKNINFAFVDPASTSGYLIPSAGLAKYGITDPKTQFKNMVYAGGHDTAVLSVIQGKTDAGAIGRNPGSSFDPVVTLENSGTIPKDDLRYLWQSDPIPPTPFQIRGDLDPALAAKVKDAILNMKTRDFKAYLEYNSTAKPDDNTSFIAVTDQDYAYLTQLARDAGMIK